MAVQGIQLPVELQIQNLQEIASQLKKFTNSNILSSSFGGKKIESELDKILSRLEQVQAKTKTAFTTNSNFSSVEKDVTQIELGLNRIRQNIANLTFKDLKIPNDVQGQIEALQGRIRELNNSLLTFKGTQKENLVNNQSFMANLKVAEPTQAAKMLEKGYDDLYQAINTGMNKVNTTLALKAAAFKEQQEIFTQNSAGKSAMTQWGALGFIQEAFKALPKDDSKKSETQKLMSSIMNYSAGDKKSGGEFTSFQRGAIGQNSFLKTIQKQFEFTPEEMNEIRSRLKQQATELKASVTQVLKQMGSDDTLAKNILFGPKVNIVENLKQQYEDQQAAVKKLEAEYNTEKTRSEAYANVQAAFEAPNQAIAQKAQEISIALEAPTAALEQYQQALLQTVMANPELAASFGAAAQNISAITGAIDAGRAKLEQMDQTISKMQGVSSFINRYIGVYAIARKVTQAIRNAFNNIKELDKSITNIAVVTNMSQADLWNKIGDYTSMAQQFGVATKDVYTVSQLFYQQGLQTNQVMSLTTETLKMAKISGMGYEEAANAMTVAVRAFKIEMTDAQQVTDTYSALAAKFAVSSAEIANAMEKTASSAANVGMSLQSTSAFMSVMIQTTRESAQNIGSALKSIISRYGEMKASPSTLLNVDGEEVAFNKVDTALKSVGISIKDASGQFRDFDDVIMELAAKWDSLDNNTQRYIATVMAGNRQQSRFIALVSNYDELNRAMNVASSSENASIVQVAKTMDSLESKTNQLKNAFAQLYLDLHLEEGLKGAYDWLTRIVSTIGKLGMLKGVLPTLMTAINAGFGAKGLINMGIDKYKQRRTDLQMQVDADVTKARPQIESLIKDATTPREMPINTQVDDTQLKDVEARLNNINATQGTTGTISPAVVTPTQMTPVSVNDFYSKLYTAQAAGSLATVQGRAETLADMGVSEDSGVYSQLSAMMASFTGAASAADEMATVFATATGQIVTTTAEVETAVNTVVSEITQEAAEHTNNTGAIQNNTNAVIQNAQAMQSNSALFGLLSGTLSSAVNSLGQLALPAGQLTGSFMQLMPPISLAGTEIYGMIDGVQTSATLLESGLKEPTSLLGLLAGTLVTVREAADGASYALFKVGEGTRNRQAYLPGKIEKEEEDFIQPTEKSHWYSKFFQKNKDTGKTEFSRKGFQAMSVATGVARMVAPFITAIGASIKDKSTDALESSKIFTGLGNGLSGAATGAQIGMAAGPWGAAIGALGGFVLNGLSAIIDGANYTLTERIANLKQEAQEAADESLKRQAKVIDLSSTIDNLKNLHNAMYNSAEDMQAYQDAVGTAADSYPELISAYDEAGNAIIDLQAAETALSEARLAGARAAKTAAIKELEVSDKQIELYNQQAANTGHISNLEKYINFKQTYPNGISREELRKYINDPVMHSIGMLDRDNRLDDSWKKTELYEFNEWIKENASTIGKQNLWDLTGIDTNKKFVDWDLSDIQLAVNSINSIVKKANTTNDLLKDQVNAAIGLESFLSFINFDNGISQEQVSQLETSKNFQNLFNRALLNLKPEEYNDLNEWQTAENSDFSVEVSKLYNDSFKSWYDSLSTGLKETFNNLDYTEYKNADELVHQFNLEGTDLEASFINNFIEANKGNRERILKTIYQYENGEKTNQFNEDLTGITKINRQRDAKDIADRFTQKTGAKGKVLASTRIISKYADYFSEQLVNINKLADDGYVALATTRFDALNNLSENLGKIKESSVQNDLFGVITSIDLSSYASISSAYDSIKEYGKENNKVAEVAPLLASLVEAQNSLIYNVNTVAQELTDIITSAAKDIDNILSTNKSGISFDKAIEEFDKLNAQFADVTSFNDIFTFDAVLGKYVYTTDGLQKAIEAKEKELANTVEQLNNSAEIYTKIIATNKNGEWDTEAAFTEISNWDVTPEELFKNMRELQIINTDDLKVQNAYQELIKGYLDITEIDERSGESFEKYLEKRAQEVSEMQGAAQTLLEQYQFNKKSQYYQAIDWSKLALGTDYTNTNKLLVKSLAKELGLYTETYNEAGKLIATHWEAGYSEEDWEKILQEFLDQEYAGNDAGRAAAEAAIRSALEQSKVEQVSNAISELLSNEVASLSVNSIALIQQLEGYGTQFEVNGEGQLQILDDGVKAGITNISLALEEYQINVANGTLNTISKINEEYTKIINASFAKSQATQTLLSSGNTLDFNTIESTFSSLELKVEDYWDSTTQAWKNGLEDVFETDIFGKTKIKSWNNYLQWIARKRGTSVAEIKKSPEYEKYYSSYIDAVISDQDSQDIEKQIANTLSTLANAKVGTRVNVSALSAEMQEQLDGNADDIYTVVSEAMRDQAILALEATGSEESDVIIRELQRSIKSKNAKGNILNNITNKNVSNDALRTYLDKIVNPEFSIDKYWDDATVQLAAKNRGFIWDEYTQSYRATLEAVATIRKDIEKAEADNTATPEYIAELKALANQLEIDLSKDPAEEALRALLANYTNAEGQLAVFEAYFGKLEDEYKYTDEKGNIVIKVEELREKLGDEYSKIFTDVMNQIADSYIDNASKIGQFLTEGTTSRTEMAAFQTAYSQLMGGETIDFFYDSVLQAWTFDASKLRGYLEAAATKLDLGENSSQWVEDQIEALTVDNLDFSAYLSGSASQKDQNKLRKNLKDYFKTHTKEYNMLGTAEGIEQWATSQTDDVLATLSKGGQDAINELKKIKGELTTEEISAAYRAQVEPLKSLFDTLDELQAGSIVATNQIDALRAAGFQVNADGVVEVVGDLVEAYKSLYDQMKNTGEATLAELNTAMGKYLDNRDGQQQAIDALGNATNMTFSQLAEIYTAAGLELTEELVDAMEQTGIIHSLGGNKLMIKDFKAFASQMGWKAGSEEYINAFKAYNDSLIDYDRQVEKSIVEEIKNVAGAKAGDKINLTYLTSILGDGLDTWLEAEGTVIKDGILTLANDADIADIASQLLAMAKDKANLIPEEIAEIADAINEVLTHIASLIKEGIAGTLSNVNKTSLESWGKSNGLNLQFTQTTEGFKLAQESAIQVYYTLKNIDALQGKLVFDELNKSLQEANEHYKSISDIANRIKQIESMPSDARTAQYEQELALAKEIYAVRSTTEDSSFSFMSNKIPGGQNNPINYFNDWAQAIHTFNDALKSPGTYTRGGENYESGFVDYSFWYNLVTEMNNIAALGGDIVFAGETLDGSLEAASNLIEKGAKSLVVTDTGEVKVALSGMSLNFEEGADAFSSNVTEGIQKMAKSQSDMLGGLIKVLELVVAMEKLGDITGDNDTIDVTDLFPKFDVEGGKQKLNEIEGLDAFIKQAGDSLDSIVINNETLTQMIARARDEGLDKTEAENFAAIMDSLYQMYKSGDYNLDNIYDSIQQIMAASKFTGTVELGDTILHIKNGAVIIETEDEKGKKQFQTPNGEKYDTMGEAIARSAVMAQGIKEGITFGKDTKLEQEVAAGTLTIKTLGVDIEVKSDKQGNLTFDGEKAANINEYVQKLIDSNEKMSAEEKLQAKVDIGFELGTTKLDSFSYKSLASDVRQKLEEALASGEQAKVDLVIDENAVLSQLKGKTGAEIAEMLHLDDVKVIVDNSQATEAINAVTEALDTIDGRVATTTIITYKKTIEEGITTSGTSSGNPSTKKPNFKTNYVVDAHGNVGTARAKGTLLGELGPELIVSGGRYFVAGQNGPEMMNLADDAIVFNHLQTKSLLEKGTSKGRGRAITNERNAVSYATGNVNGGPAMASASAALHALRQLKAQWDALAGLSAQDLAGKGGGGGGGGGDPKAFLKDLERWYDWLQQIAQLEKEITLEEAKRSKYQSDMIARGKEYFTSQMASLEKLQEQAIVQKSLNDSQEEYFQKRLKEINQQSAFSALYGFSETGQLYYKDVYKDNKSAFEWLSDLVGRNEVTGEANYTAQEQYNRLVEAGFGFAMEYDSSGNKIKQEGTDWYNTALQAFWDKIDRDKEEMQSLHDSIEDGKKKLLELEEAQNEILHEIEDNQIEVENKVLKAIEEARQREIDELKDTKEALEDGAKNLADGLNKQLDNERKMLDNQKNADELAGLQRRLAILQRSGGSAAAIADLQNQINEKQQDRYFDLQEQQIQAVQDASDAQIERLDNQIELMEEVLEYQKEHGLLWADVDAILQQSAEDIVNFIQGNTSEYWGKSTAELQKVIREDLFEVERFKEFQGTVEEGMEALIEKFGSEEQKKALADKRRAEAAAQDAANAAQNQANTATTSGSSNKNNSNTKSTPQPTRQEKIYVTTFNGKEIKFRAFSDTPFETVKAKFASQINQMTVPGANAYGNKMARDAAIRNIHAYALGGYDYDTGLAMLHGTKDKPEAVFNAEQTRVLREQLLSNRPDSVLSLLKSYRDAYHGLSNSTYDSISNNSNATTIEHAEVNLNIDKLANDYDAKRAADTIMDEMLRIASKTSAKNSVRR